MFIVIGATDAAQQLIKNTNTDEVSALVRQAKEQGQNNTKFQNGLESVYVTFNNATYYVWYHDAGSYTYNQNGNGYPEKPWTELSGSYVVPENQYRTRIFFVSDPDGNQNHPNAGNLIDAAKAGQYKKYRVEYYSEKEVNGQLVAELKKSETGEALLYSTQPLTYLLEYTAEPVQRVLVNGAAYPYDLYYTGGNSPVFYIQNYADSSDFNRGD
jgi:hypothetical protein